MTLIEEYQNAIIDNLPEWNYQGAKKNPRVRMQIYKFQKACQQIDTQQDSVGQLSSLMDIIQKYVPDNHVFIKFENKNLRPVFFNHERVNLAIKQPVGFQMNDVSKISVQPDKEPWLVGTIPYTKIGVVAIPSFGGHIEKQTKQRQDFINTFFQEKDKWKTIIFDFRGNTGGDSAVIKELTERMGQKPVKYADKSEIVNTPAGQKKQSEGYVSENQHCFIKKSDSFQGPVIILQDNYNASAAEAAVYMMSQLPNAITIGENTSGTYQGGATTELEMSVGSLIVGTVYRENKDKYGRAILESEGMMPDIKCKSEEALNKAFEFIKKQSNARLLNNYILNNNSSIK